MGIIVRILEGEATGGDILLVVMVILAGLAVGWRVGKRDE